MERRCIFRCGATAWVDYSDVGVSPTRADLDGDRVERGWGFSSFPHLPSVTISQTAVHQVCHHLK